MQAFHVGSPIQACAETAGNRSRWRGGASWGAVTINHPRRRARRLRHRLVVPPSVSNIVRYLRERQPRAYQGLMRAKLVAGNLRVAAARRRNLSRMVGRDTRVEIAGRVGLGGILGLGANALLLGERLGRPVALSFTSPLYRPRNGPSDWLENYFDRLGRHYDETFATVEVGRVPRVPSAAFADEAAAMWRYLKIKDSVLEDLAHYSTERMLAIHYRGSDKFLEATRVARERVLASVDEELAAGAFNHVFVASDEPDFIDQVLQRYAGLAFALPQLAVAEAGRPAHFADAPGEVKALEALQTMVMLSRAQVCVRTPSSLSDWASTLASSSSRFRLVD